MVGHLTPLDPAFTARAAAAQHALMQHTDAVTAIRQAYSIIYQELNRQAHLWAFVDNFRLFALLAVCCLPLIFLFKRVQHGEPPVAAAAH
jgi:hypothetical protein